MIEIDRIANIIRDGLKPFNDHEERKLREKDRTRREETFVYFYHKNPRVVLIEDEKKGDEK